MLGLIAVFVDQSAIVAYLPKGHAARHHGGRRHASSFPVCNAAWCPSCASSMKGCLSIGIAFLLLAAPVINPVVMLRVPTGAFGWGSGLCRAHRLPAFLSRSSSAAVAGRATPGSAPAGRLPGACTKPANGSRP